MDHLCVGVELNGSNHIKVLLSNNPIASGSRCSHPTAHRDTSSRISGFGPESFVLHAVETEGTGAESVCGRCESCRESRCISMDFRVIQKIEEYQSCSGRNFKESEGIK